MQNCSWLCFPAGAPESALSCQAVFLAEYHSHRKILDHAVIQPIVTHTGTLKKQQDTHKRTQSQACSVTSQQCWVISLSTDTDSEMKPVVGKLLKYTVKTSSLTVVGHSTARRGQLSLWIVKIKSKSESDEILWNEMFSRSSNQSQDVHTRLQQTSRISIVMKIIRYICYATSHLSKTSMLTEKV